MKKVILKSKEPSEIMIDDIQYDLIYAMYHHEFGQTFVITRDPQDLTTDDPDRLAYNTMPLYADPPEFYAHSHSLKTLIEELIRQGFEVFQFESELDFTDWIRNIYSSL